MDLTCNVTSIDQISFKLTETHLPSTTHLPYPVISFDSLAYTNSFVSLQHILYQNQPQNIQPPTPQPSYIQKNSSLKTTCADMSALTPLKQTQKTSFRQRVVSTGKANEKPTIKRRLSVHIMSIDDALTARKISETPLHSPHPAPFRAKQTRKKSVSGKQLHKSKKLVEWQGLELQSSMRIRGLVLENHLARQKSFMRRIMQNRSNVVHATQSISRQPQILTARHNSRKQENLCFF